MAQVILNDSQVEELLIEIITGKKLFTASDGSIMAVRFPTTQERDMGRLVYMKNMKELAAGGVPTMDEMKKRILSMDLLERSHYRRVDMLTADLDAFRKAYEKTTSSMQKQQLKLEIEKRANSLEKLNAKERSLMANTAEVQAENVKIDYFVSRCTLAGDELNEQRWKTYDEYCSDSDVKTSSVSRYNFMMLSIGLPVVTIRAVARTPEWRNRWKSLKQTGASVFSGSSSEWDRNKVAICYWSDFYDSIYEYPHPPPEEVICDDEKLFDWIRDVNRVNSTQSEKVQRGGVNKSVDTPYKVRPTPKIGQRSN